jgi:hypothetical protein
MGVWVQGVSWAMMPAKMRSRCWLAGKTCARCPFEKWGRGLAKKQRKKNEKWVGKQQQQQNERQEKKKMT